MTQILELPGRDFTFTTICMLRKNGKSRQHLRADGSYKQRDKKSIKELKGNTSHQKHCRRNEQHLDVLTSRLDTMKERIRV